MVPEVLPVPTVPRAISGNGKTILGRNYFYQNDSVYYFNIPEGYSAIQLYAISHDGNIVTGIATKQFTGTTPKARAIRYVNGVFEDLGILGNENDSPDYISEAYCISADGTAIAGHATNAQGNGRTAFRWKENTFTDLGSFPGEGTSQIARDISFNGEVVVGTGNIPEGGGNRAFRWENGILQNLGILSGFISSQAFGTNKDGSIVVGNLYNSNVYPNHHSNFIWKEGLGMIHLSQYIWLNHNISTNGHTLNGIVRIAKESNTITGRAHFGEIGTVQPYEGFVIFFEQSETELIVNSSADRPNLSGQNNCNTGELIEINGEMVSECTLRAAIQALNNRNRKDSISFNIEDGGTHIINLGSPLPVAEYPLILDASTQPGYNGLPLITLNGLDHIENGFVLEQGESIVRGFSIGGFTNAGILISGGAGNTIEANHIGVNATGTTSIPNRTGLIIDNSSGNQIGGGDLSQINVISGNTDAHDVVKMREERTGIGIMIQGAGSTDNRIQGNRVGTDYSGQQEIGNGHVGVFIHNASENMIGGDEESSGNVISANTAGNVFIFGKDATDNIISGNIIGTNLEGTKSLTQNGTGVSIFSGSRNRIGGSTDTPGKAPGNLISGHNGGGGVVLAGINPEAISSETENTEIGIASENIIAGNLIGTNRDGTSALPNQTGVVPIYDAHKTMIGGDQPGYRNIISGNEVGIILADTTGGFAPHESVIAGNYIGTNIHGNAALGNNGPGILVSSLSRFPDESTGIAGVRIGGTANSSRNIVAGNKEKQIEVLGPVSAGTVILNNYIGVLANGQAGQTPADSEYGLMIKTNETFIGEDPEGNAAPNVIGGNQYGIVLVGDVNAVSGGNKIGTNPGGTVAVPNHTGIWVLGNNNVILGNTVSGNKNYGIEIGQQPGSPAFEGEFFNPDNTTIVRNMIGTNSQGNSAIGNGLGENGAGLVFWRGSNLHLYINTISGNHHGVHIANSPSQAGTQMSGNIIGGGGVVPNEISGTVALPEFVPVPNMGDGVHITDGRVYLNNEPKNDLLNDLKVGNFIQNNLGAGVRRTGSNLSSHFELLSNYFFNNAGLAIDFGPEGAGAGNSMHEPPVLMQPVFSEETARIRGVSAVNGIIQLYTSPICHPSGHGEGRLYLSEKDQVVSAGQEFSTEVSLPQNLRVGFYITALVTHNNRTSEFCPCVRIADEDKYQEQLLDELYLKAINLLGVTLTFSDTKSQKISTGKNSVQEDPFRIYASEFNLSPDHSYFEGSALAPDGTEITPNKIDTAVYWTLGADNIPDPVYDICVDISGQELTFNQQRLVLVHRSGIGNPWKPLNTTVGEDGTLCASGLTSFGDIAIATYDESIPTTIALWEQQEHSTEPFSLFQNYPNPFEKETTISFDLHRSGNVKVEVYDVYGKQTRVLWDGYLPSGSHNLKFRANSLPSGIYFYRIENEGLSATKRMMKLK